MLDFPIANSLVHCQNLDIFLWTVILPMFLFYEWIVKVLKSPFQFLLNYWNGDIGEVGICPVLRCVVIVKGLFYMKAIFLTS